MSPILLPDPSSYASRFAQACKGKKNGNETTCTVAAAELKRVARQHVPALLSNSSIGVAVTNAEGRFVSVNHAFCGITGYSERELYSRDWISVTHPDDREENFARACRVLEGKTSSFVIEKRYLSKRGDTVWVRNSTFLLRHRRERYAGAIVFVEDITELKQAEEARRKLSSSLLRLQEEERRRIARELHDSTGQALAALLMTLAPLKNEILRLDPACRRALSASVELAKQAAREVRTFSYLLHPPMLDELGFGDALRSYVRGFRQRSGIDVMLVLPKDLPPLPQAVELALFRILQEGLNNVRLHSRSSRAIVRLRHNRGDVRLMVRDFGRGFKSGTARRGNRGVGISGMSERVQQLGGKFELKSGKHGTVVKVAIPVSVRCASADSGEPAAGVAVRAHL